MSQPPTPIQSRAHRLWCVIKDCHQPSDERGRGPANPSIDHVTKTIASLAS